MKSIRSSSSYSESHCVRNYRNRGKITETEEKKRPYFSSRASGAAIITPEDFILWRLLQFSAEKVSQNFLAIDALCV